MHDVYIVIDVEEEEGLGLRAAAKGSAQRLRAPRSG